MNPNSALSSTQERASRSTVSRGVLAVAALAGALVVATLALWAHYGTAVFVETIVAGLAACF